MNDNKPRDTRNPRSRSQNRSKNNTNSNRTRHPARRHAANRSRNSGGNGNSNGNRNQSTRSKHSSRVQKPIEVRAAAHPSTIQKPAPTIDWRWILIAKGLGIALVVIGHFQPAVAPQWYKSMVSVIYSFHMPLFLLLSGYLYVYGKQKYGALIWSKVKRLVVPFISIGAIFFIVKYLVGRSATLDHPIGPNSILDLLLNPASSYVPLLWFVHALFLMFIAFVPLRAMFRYTALVFLLAVIVNTLWAPLYMPGLHKILAHFPFFIAGVWLRESGQLDLIRKAGWMRIAGACALGFTLIYWLGYSDTIYLDAMSYPIRLALGVLGALIVIALSFRLDLAGGWLANAAAITGMYSMTIYLIHTLFESGVRIIAFQKLALPAGFFIPVALVAIAAGLIMPLLLEKYVLRKFGVTRRLILGLN